MTIPLIDDSKEAILKVSKVTSTLRTGFAKVYASYILSIIFGFLLPRFICKMMVDIGTLPPTVAFSNIPGP